MKRFNTLQEYVATQKDEQPDDIWLRDRADFPGFNQVYGEYFPDDPPARSAVVSELLVDVRVEIEVVAMIKKGQMKIRVGDTRSFAEQFYALAA